MLREITRSRPRLAPRVVSLVAPLTLALLAARCGSPPPAAAPAAGQVEVVADAQAPSWDLPGMALVTPRRVILLTPPPSAPDAASIRAYAPDPPPLVTRGRWVYDFRYDKGEISLGGIHRTELKAPEATPRVMGRFALELYAGKALLERVRFDFPGLGGTDRAPAPSADGGKAVPLHSAAFSFTAKIVTRVGVMFPATPHGTRLELWDRATDQRYPLPWPAVETTVATESGSVEAGVSPGQ